MTERPVAARAVLARYTAAAALARLADEGSRVALLLLVLADGHGAAFGGLLIAALMVPHVLAAPVVGALADRVRRRGPLYAAGLLGYGAALLGAGLTAGPAPTAAFALAVAAGCCAPLMIGGLTSLLGELPVGPLPRAFGLDAASYSVAGIAGPAVAAVVAEAAGGLWSVAALAASCAAGAILVGTLPIPVRPTGTSERAPGGAWTALWRRPALGAVTAGTTISMAGTGALPLAAAALAGGLGDTALTGLVLSAMAAGNLVSALLYARFPIRRWRPESVVLAGLFALAVPFAVLAVVPGRGPALALALFAVAGLVDGPLFASLLAVRDREAPPAVRTRVFTIGAGLKVTAAAAGAALGGLAAGHGAAVLLLAVAAAQVVAGGTAAAVLRRGRGQVLEGRAGAPGVQ